jgi:hypothetical protein
MHRRTAFLLHVSARQRDFRRFEKQKKTVKIWLRKWISGWKTIRCHVQIGYPKIGVIKHGLQTSSKDDFPSALITGGNFSQHCSKRLFVLLFDDYNLFVLLVDDYNRSIG